MPTMTMALAAAREKERRHQEACAKLEEHRLEGEKRKEDIPLERVRLRTHWVAPGGCPYKRGQLVLVPASEVDDMVSRGLAVRQETEEEMLVNLLRIHDVGLLAHRDTPRKLVELARRQGVEVETRDAKRPKPKPTRS